jgi:hypothetical protein
MVYKNVSDAKRYAQEYYQRPEIQIREKARQQTYRKSPEGKAVLKKYNHSSKKKMQSIAWNKKMWVTDKNNYRKKVYARQMVYKHKISRIECIVCGSKELLQRHHLDYDKPLEVVILCLKCHIEEHKKLKTLKTLKTSSV